MTSRSCWRMVTDGRQKLHKISGMNRFTDDRSIWRGAYIMQLIRSLPMLRLGYVNCDRVRASMQRSVIRCLVWHAVSLV